MTMMMMIRSTLLFAWMPLGFVSAWIPTSTNNIPKQHQQHQQHHQQQQQQARLSFFQRTPSLTILSTSSSSSSSTTAASSTTDSPQSSSSSSSFDLPRLQVSHMEDLARQGYVIIPNFLSEDFQAELRDDISALRAANYFNKAKIGQDATNTLNTNIRVAETCFLSQFMSSSDQHPHSTARSQLLQILQQMPNDLKTNAAILNHANAKTRHIPTSQLDTTTTSSASSSSPSVVGSLHEWLYAYYPQGGFYRRHVDALPGSASTLRCYSLLLYLNDNAIWKKENDNDQQQHGGQLRMHFDSGRDELPNGESPNYMDVIPYGGTLVVFSSRDIPHEVVDTNLERLAVVGWFNRILLPSDVWELANGGGGGATAASPQRLGMLAASATLLLVGVYQLMQSM